MSISDGKRGYVQFSQDKSDGRAENCVILVDPIALGTAESTFIAGAAWVQRSTIRLLPYRCHSDDSANRNAANT